ncbi:hypothetical protein AWH62_12650 [Maricaulis sp. W15]|uniref:hypothetical protein n=1 Tax=Maricaulis sp. W15 TaxID=1772333 RepID=UPI0009491071|nr:hypothetical protein [Maricaulis sp. W15]OLF71391.1 hypothetical protein AWH62_12650 [Maricaulis sp. W15]
MKRLLICGLVAASLSACAVVPVAAPAGPFETEGDFSVMLQNDWSRWPSQINPATNGEFLTQDGVLLNRVHLVSIPDSEGLVRARRNVEMPLYTAGSSEFEIVEFITSSLEMIGYSDVEADLIRPAEFDGVDGLRFGLTGIWQNGMRVKGEAATIAHDDRLDLVLFMAPELHYYDAVAPEVEAIMNSIDLPD